MKLIQNKFSLLLLAGLVLFTGLGLVAQQQGRHGKHGQHKDFDPAKKAQHMTERMKEHLQLSEAQVQQVQVLNLEFATNLKAKLATVENPETKKALRPEIKALRDAHKAKIEAILSPEQVQLMKESHGKHGPNPEKRAAKMSQLMIEELGLDTDQAAKLTALNQEFAAEVMEKHEAARETEKDPRAMHKEMRALHKAQEAKIKGLLNPEQLEKFEAFKEAHPHPGPGGHHDHREGMGKNKELHQALKAYKKENIHPVIKAERMKFETVLTADEKAKIEELRARRAALKSDMQACRKGSKDCKGSKGNKDCKASKCSGEGPSEEMKSKKAELHLQRKAIGDEVKVIADAHEADLKAIHEKLKPQEEKWKADIKAIHEEFKPEGMEMQEGDHRMGPGGPHGHPGHHRKGGKGKPKLGPGDHQKMHKVVHFILIDPNREEMDEMGQMKRQPAPIRSEVTISPNPAGNANTLAYSLELAGKVKIELMGTDGKVIKTLLNKNQEAGTFTLEVDTQDLASGTYYYVITGPQGSTAKKFVIAK